MAEQRVMEAKKLGFETCILPQVCKDSLLSTGATARSRLNGITLVGVSNVKEALDAIRSR